MDELTNLQGKSSLYVQDIIRYQKAALFTHFTYPLDPYILSSRNLSRMKNFLSSIWL